MAVLGQIRKRSFFLIIVIGMALFAFVISGVFDGNTNNNSLGEPIAIINDKEITLGLFRNMVEQAERNYNLSTMQAVNRVWDEMLRLTIFEQEFDELGIDAGRDQIEMILAKDQRIAQDPRFQNSSGIFDFGIFTDFVNQLRLENPQAYQNWRSQEESIAALAKQNIYYSLIRSSSGFTELEGKNAYHLENDKVNLRFIRIPYNQVPDTLFKVSDNDIKKYVKEKSDQYYNEASRSLNYVLFPDIATDDDKILIRNNLEKLKLKRIEYNQVSKLNDTINGLKSTENLTEFIDQYSDTPFDSIYRSKGQFSNEYADILFNLNKGDVFGPYQDGNEFKISKFVDRKKGGSIRASHILISFKGSSGSNNLVQRDKSEAKKLADEYFFIARKKTTDFSEMAIKYSDGPSSPMGGDLGFFQEGTMTQNFFNFCNKSRVGKIGLIETEFGFHVVKVTDKEDTFLIADIVKKIVPSEETSNDIFKKTTQFEMESINSKDFIKTAEKYNYENKFINQVNILDENLPMIKRQRNLVKWLFDDQTRVGDIKRFSLSDGGYVIAQLAKITPKGSINLERIREEVQKKIIQKRKAAYLLEMYNSEISIDSLSVILEREVETASAITQKNNVLPGAGSEPYVIGTAFSMDLNQTSKFIEGNTGIYKIELTSKERAKELESYQAYANLLASEENLRIKNLIFDALKSSAEIEDNRELFY